jgi:D-xylose 1-dehydrogenase (NADP+, D-xylono-1,5-lactone-forming)
MTNTGEVRWGVLGSAKITEAEVGPAMLRARRSRVVAVASRRLESARQLAAALGAERAFGSYEELLKDPDVDAVYIPLPNTMHKEWTLAALAAGKHVLCEKPMGMTGDEVREMIAAAERSGRVLMEGFMWRFHPRVARVRQLIADGVIGDVRLVRATYTFDLAAASDVRSGSVDDDIRLNPAMGGGALTDLGSYCVNGLRTYAGSRPVEVVSFRQGSPGREVETTISGEVLFENGVIGQFFAALDLPGGGHVEIVGTEGRIRMVNAFRIREVQGPFVVEVLRLDGELSETHEFQDQYELELEHFADMVLDGAEPVIPLEDSLDNALTLEAIRRAWDEGIVRVPAR